MRSQVNSASIISRMSSEMMRPLFYLSSPNAFVEQSSTTERTGNS